MSIPANPSHLEAVNPVVIGKVRAIQDFTDDTERLKSFGVLMHGDAAFSGQGIVYETIQMQDLKKYKTGGTLHIIVNNQIGFTTTPKEARTGLNCTEVAKSIGAPIFHVNADYPEAVDQAIKMAFEFRMKFKKDVVVDIIGYRRFGHNELDQPSFTQPIMYKIIGRMKPIFDFYAENLLKEGVINKEYITESVQKYNKKLEEAYDNSRNHKFNEKNWIAKPWEEIRIPTLFGHYKETGVAKETLRYIGEKICTIPKSFHTHSIVQRIYEQRLKSIIDEKGIDWATAEALAFSTLLYEGFRVRLSGQDVERGTFSHRHCVVIDQEDHKKHLPLCNILDEEDKYLFIISNSHLSENGVLGFEYGYSICNPNVLVIWEAQFGDFSNGAQFSSQLKACNIQIVNCTTAANYFHVLRRQLRRLFRKPLIVISPKKMLNKMILVRFKGSTSELDDFKTGKHFQEVIGEVYPNEILAEDKIEKVIFCTGQVYYDLIEKRKNIKNQNTAIIRIEQLAPFPYSRVEQEITKYTNAKEIVWCQEEHKNSGAWTFVIKTIDPETLNEVRYVGRLPSAAPATGNSKVHSLEQNSLLSKAFGEEI